MLHFSDLTLTLRSMTTAEETSSSQHTAPLSSIIHPSWAQALEPVEPHIRAMGELLRAEQAQGIRILPAGSLILRAFTYPLDSKILTLLLVMLWD